MSVCLYLSVCLSLYPSVCLSVPVSVGLSVPLCVCLSVNPSVRLFLYQSVYLSLYPSVSACFSVCLSLYLSLCVTSQLVSHPHSTIHCRVSPVTSHLGLADPEADGKMKTVGKVILYCLCASGDGDCTRRCVYNGVSETGADRDHQNVLGFFLAAMHQRGNETAGERSKSARQLSLNGHGVKKKL